MNAKIYVATNIVKTNKDRGEHKPAIIVERGAGITLSKQVEILDGQNQVIARVVQSDQLTDTPYIFIEAGPLTIHP